jgi:uncharacterized protein YutE (UPF0331/DUF86 family)
MVIANLNIKLIEDRLGFINKAISILKKLANYSEQDFLNNENSAVAESYLRRSLEAVFDIGRHIIAKSAGKGIVEYKEIARSLGDNGVISKDCSNRLILMAGYINRLIHFYHEVEDKELYVILKENLADIEKFVTEIKSFLMALKVKE